MYFFKILTKSDFKHEFKRVRPDQFTDDALNLLYLHILDSAPENGLELDVIAICCDYAEYDLRQLSLEYRDIDLDKTGEALRKSLLFIDDLVTYNVDRDVFLIQT